MKIELIKVNKPNGDWWYGLFVDGSVQIPAFGQDLEAATAAYNKTIENQKNPQPKEEIILSTELTPTI